MALDSNIILSLTYLLYGVSLVAGILLYNKYKTDAHLLNELAPPTRLEGKVNPFGIHQVDLLGVGLLALLFVALYGLTLIPPEVGADGEPPAKALQLSPAILILGMVGQMIPGGIVILLLAVRGIRLLDFLGLRKPNIYHLLIIAPMGVVYTYMFIWGLSSLGYSEWLVHLFGKEIKLQDALQIYQNADEPIIRILLAVSVVIIAPIVEEVVFRGYIYAVTKRFTARIFSTLISAVLFAVVHNYIPGLVPLAFLAILLTISYEITGSLWAPISMHALFNGITLIAQEYKFHQS